MKRIRDGRAEKRDGFTLIELIAVMASLSVLAGIAVIVMLQLFLFRTRFELRLEQQRGTNRLVQRFREDVRRHGKPDLPATENEPLRWKTADGGIVYRLEPGLLPDRHDLWRTVLKNGKRTKTEKYPLPEHGTIRFVEGKGEDAGLVALSLWTALPGEPPPAPERMNPFTRTVSGEDEMERHMNWRTAVAAFRSRDDTGQ